MDTTIFKNVSVESEKTVTVQSAKLMIFCSGLDGSDASLVLDCQPPGADVFFTLKTFNSNFVETVTLPANSQVKFDLNGDPSSVYVYAYPLT